MNLCFDPMDRIGNQTRTLRWVIALDRLHQTKIAFLDQVGMRNAIAQVLARNRNDEAQVGEH